MITKLFQVLDPAGRRHLRSMLAGLVVAAALQAVAFVLLVPLLAALLGDEPADAWPWVAALGATFAGYAWFHWTSQMTGYRVGTGLSRTLHHGLGDAVARLPLGWFSVARTGQLAQLASTSVVDVMSVPASLLRPVVTAVVTPAVVVAAMAVLDWRLAVAAVVTVPMAVLTWRLTARLTGSADHAVDAAAVDAAGRVVEFAQNQPVLRAFRRTTDGHGLLDDALVAQRDAGRRLLLRVVPGFTAFVLVLQLGFTVVLLAGTYLALGGTVATIELVALLVLAVRFVEPLIVAADVAGAIRMASNALDRVNAVITTPALPEPAGPGRPGEPSVEFADVTFGYEPGRPVLSGVSLTVPPRTMTAIVGPSGAGKTTLVRLVARFWDVGSGVVRVAGEDVRDLTTEQLMAQVSLVFQDVYLFDGTIADNVRLARPDATPDELAEAARLARVDEIVARLPDGWDTRVGEGGTALSGGERQRVSIARAILKDAPIVLLDEATAALDPENEAAVQEALAALTADRTLLVVAHRLQTVAAADQIAVLDGGRIVELGRHEALLARGGRYADFWRERNRARGWRLSGAGTAAPGTAAPGTA